MDKLLNHIKYKYDNLKKENVLLNDKLNKQYESVILENEALKKQIDELQNNKINLVFDKIPVDIIYKFGCGPIRYYEEGKYYHGVGCKDIYSWNHNNKYNRVITEYINKVHILPHPQWDTHNAKDFCCNCKYDDNIYSKKQKVLKLYKCLGHGKI